MANESISYKFIYKVNTKEIIIELEFLIIRFYRLFGRDKKWIANNLFVFSKKKKNEKYIYIYKTKQKQLTT